MNSFVSTFRKISSSVFVLAAIFIIGIFLRTFYFHDWLRFNADQSRDAGIVSDVVEGKTSAPLLGPKAGGTEFRLGSAFYIFQIASASLFGNRPDAMAYPDLISSLLAIPLLYAFLRLYFERKTALFLTALFAVSFYGVKYSRFAWNPNSLPFWTLLFFLLFASSSGISGKGRGGMEHRFGSRAGCRCSIAHVDAHIVSYSGRTYIRISRILTKRTSRKSIPGSLNSGCSPECRTDTE